MQLINEMKIEFLSKSNNESFARIVTAGFVASIDPTLDELADIKTAVSEAVTNSIIHGYENADDKLIRMHCRLFNRGVEIKISDKGIGIKDINEARKPLFTSKPNLERSGMGFTVMETFMDSVIVDSKPGEGTTVTMYKTINKDFAS
ncbi:MAG: anti-sigma F factor [Clostridiales bacterium]|nr:anti-sigma F factor [Clostridiales bacterium]